MLQYEKTVQLWQSFNIQTVNALDMRLDSFRIQFAYNSAKIENPEVTYHATREVFTDGIVKTFKGNPDTLTEINNQKKCYDFLLPKIIAKEPLSIELIKKTHKITTAGTYDNRRYLELGEEYGEFKRHDFVVGKNEVGSAPEDVESDLRGLLSELASTPNLSEPIKIFRAATYFHMLFEYIHPFADGNGRVGRTLMNYFLMINNHPPLVVYDDDRDEYYSSLEHYCATEELEPLIGFFVRQLEKTWKKSVVRAEKRELV